MKINLGLKRDLAGLLEKEDTEETIKRAIYIAKLVVKVGRVISLSKLTEVPT